MADRSTSRTLAQSGAGRLGPLRASGRFVQAAILLIALAARAPAGPTHFVDAAPRTLGEEGATYILSKDLTSATDGFLIAADRITLDGNGHSLTCASGEAIRTQVAKPGRTGATIRRLTSNRGAAIFYGGRHTIEDCRLGPLALYGSSDNAVRRCRFSGGLVLSKYNDIPAQRNVIESSSFAESRQRDVNFIFLYYADRNTVRNNRVTLTDSSGQILQVQSSSHNIISGNAFTHTGPAGNMLVSIRGTRIDETQDNLYEDNTVSTTGCGWYFNGGRDDVFRRNRVFAAGFGVRLYAGNCLVRNTTIQDNLVVTAAGPALEISGDGGGGGKIVGNTVVAKRGPAFVSNLADSSLLLEMRSNILCAIDGIACIAGRAGYAGLTSDYNLFHRGAPGTLIRDGEKAYDDLLRYRAATGRDGHSLAADPVFADVAKDDYRLRPGSPCLGAGGPAGPSADSRAAPRDIGACPRRQGEDAGTEKRSGTSPGKGP